MLTVCMVFLPACLRIPKIKSIHEAPMFTENDVEKANGPIVFSARKLTQEEALCHVGLDPIKFNLGTPWIVSFTNTGRDYFYLTDKSWSPAIIDPSVIIEKFHNYCCFFISPFKKGIYLINRDELQQLLTTLHENLLPFTATLYPECNFQGIVFFPEKESYDWSHVTLYNTHNNPYIFTINSENTYE